MAITKIIAISDRLDKRVNYAINGEKTSLGDGIAYAADPEKAAQHIFVSTLNCGPAENAYAQMLATKQAYRKAGGVLGYHFIQSFAPGEVTPEQAHAIGMEFAKRLFGDRYEVVIGTHLDKEHLHNHIVVNSVSCLDGKKYHSSPSSYYNNVRTTSDELCRENDLSIITPKGKAKHYAEWEAEQTGRPTIRQLIRKDIDSVLSEAYTYQSFLMLLQRRGYIIKSGPNRKYTTVQPPGAKRAIRLDSLGEGYTEQAIKERLTRQRTETGYPSPAMQYHPYHPPHSRYRLRGVIVTNPKKKITGFHALYLRYLYLLRGQRRNGRRYRADFSFRQEVIRLEQYQKQFRYLTEQRITTPPELQQRMADLGRDIEQLQEERKPLYYKRRTTTDETEKTRYGLEIQRKTASLQALRKELALCRRIQADIPQVSLQVQAAQNTQIKIRGKEEPQHEYQRRNR